MTMPSPVRRRLGALPRDRARPVLAALALAVGAAGLTAVPADARNLDELRGKLDAESKKLVSTSGAMVVDLTSGRTLFSRRADVARSPASNEKLFTTSTALLQFGADGTLRTTARIPGEAEVTKGVLDGDLYLVGDGDPSLNDVALQALAKAVVAKVNLTAIKGGVVGDGTIFDNRTGGPDSNFGPDDDLGGQLGGLTWGHGRATPGGTATVAADRFAFFLRQAGVKISRKARAADVDAAPGGPGTVLGTAVSPPMRTLAATTNQPSDNFYAETLLKGLGAQKGTGGTTAAGVKVVTTQLKLLGLQPKVVDGSGLSRSDQATPRQIVTLLKGMYTSKVSTAFVASLAVPGRIGTLAGRMRGTDAAGRCQAKTGTLRGVSALSGYCKTLGGRVLAFSFLENGMDALRAKAVEDRMVPALVSYRP